MAIVVAFVRATLNSFSTFKWLGKIVLELDSILDGVVDFQNNALSTEINAFNEKRNWK